MRCDVCEKIGEWYDNERSQKIERINQRGKGLSNQSNNQSIGVGR